MSLTNAERERRVLGLARSYECHLAAKAPSAIDLEPSFETEVAILDRLDAERDPAYDVATTLREVDEREYERHQAKRESGVA